MYIKECRVEAGFTQLYLSELLGVPQSTLATWETGKGNPRASQLPLIADALGCSIDSLFGREKEVEADGKVTENQS